MTKAEDAVALFQQGFNCSQAILSVFAPDFGLDRDMARRISQGFGAGIARTDKICGSLSGAIMLIGLRYGGIRADDVAAKEKTYAVVGEFLQEFKTHHGSLACTDLLGYNLSDQKQFAAAKTHKEAMERCPAFIRDAVELVEKYCCNLGVPKL
jgi:C_GCAxxG_C_C family probable redox protein